jgi:hypothetical protein
LTQKLDLLILGYFEVKSPSKTLRVFNSPPN